MNHNKIACFDVYYYTNYAQAACIIFEIKPSERIISSHCAIEKSPRQYVPGQFYKRELPPLLKVYKNIEEKIDLIIIDGFVSLANGEKGLGAHFYHRLNKEIPLIGVAKTLFKGASDYVTIYRGLSSRPLYVSSIGTELDAAAQLIKNLKGDNRIPDILKRVDQLTRTR